MKSASTTETMNGLGKILSFLGSTFSAIGKFLESLSRIALRITGFLLILGSGLAIIGWLIADLNPDPLAATWLPAVWMVVIGAVILLIGMQALYIRHILRVGMIGQYGLLIFLLGVVLLIAGAVAIDVFVLPETFKLVAAVPNLSGPLQGVLNTTTSGINTATSGTTNAASKACQVLSFGSSSCPTSSSAPSVPTATVPTLDGPTLVNSILSKLGLPSMSALGVWGLVFLSGAPLALGCIMLALTFLLAGQKPRSVLFIIIFCAFLNLGGQFLLHLTFLGPFSGMLLYLSLAWLGLALCFPAQMEHLSASLFGKIHWQRLVTKRSVATQMAPVSVDEPGAANPISEDS